MDRKQEKSMHADTQHQELETGVVVLGLACALGLLAFIGYLLAYLIG